jgi:hypothetical protein
MPHIAAFFEVLDKIPTAFDVWLTCLSFSAVAFVLGWRWPRTLFVTLPLYAVLAYATASELFWSDIAEAVTKETSREYTVAVVVALVAGAALAGSGPLVRRRALSFLKDRRGREPAFDLNGHGTT